VLLQKSTADNSFFWRDLMNDLKALANQICELLRHRYPEPEVVLGSQLGGFILYSLPTVNLKATFGGLRAFIAEYLKDFVSEIGIKGSDVQYRIEFSHSPRILGSNATVEPLFSTAPIEVQSNIPSKSRPSSSTVNLWRTLVNPKSRINCFWNSREQELAFPSAGDSPPVEGSEFPSVSYQDHVDITRRFLVQRGLDVPISEADPADLHGYVPSVVQILRARGIQSEWEKYRVDEILQLVRSRLQILGATEAAIAKILIDLRSSKIEARSENQSHTVAMPTPYRAPESGEIKLRAFLARAVTQMPIDELRDLKISGATLEKTLNSL
jgi:hypothetical protein